MGFIRKKIIKGHSYYYYVEKTRVDGVPVDSLHVYLGSAEKIQAKFQGQPSEDSRISIKSFEFGKIAALLAVDEELGFREIVDGTVSKRYKKGLTIGDYLLITIFGRWCGPLSKSATAQHFSESFMGFGTKLPHKMNAQNIIAHMKYLDEHTIEGIEIKLGLRLKELGILPNMIVWDTTNNYTFIDKGEEIPKKGKSKQGRHNKNLIGLGLAVSGENIPVFHVTMPGCTNDAPLFSWIVDLLIERLLAIGAQPEDVILVFDKGNNGKKTFNKLEGKLNILGSLKKNQVPDLFQISRENYKSLYTTSTGNEVTGFSTVQKVQGREYKIVVTHNPETQKRQERSYKRAKQKILTKMQLIKNSMERTGRGRKPTTEGAVKQAVKAIYDQYASVFKYRVFQEGKKRHFEYWIDEEAEQTLFEGFGKMAVFTDKQDWSDEQIALTYNRKVFIENDFHWLKDKLLIPLTPILHRKDAKIKAHVFLCVIGLFFVRYLSRKVSDLGITDEKLMNELGKIRVGLVTTDTLKKTELVVEDMTPLQARIFSKFDMGRYLKINNLF